MSERAADVTASLRAEHARILDVVDALEALVEGLLGGDRAAAEQVPSLLLFLATFADRVHHAKEEQVLFPALERGGGARDGPLGWMHGEHERLRVEVREMEDALLALRQGRRDGWGRLGRGAATYVVLLRDHIAKEDQLVFPMAGSLAPAEAAAVLDGLARVERDEVRADELANVLDGAARVVKAVLGREQAAPAT